MGLRGQGAFATTLQEVTAWLDAPVAFLAARDGVVVLSESGRVLTWGRTVAGRHALPAEVPSLRGARQVSPTLQRGIRKWDLIMKSLEGHFYATRASLTLDFLDPPFGIHFGGR